VLQVVLTDETTAVDVRLAPGIYFYTINSHSTQLKKGKIVSQN
jgi:hypothetical protein